VPHAVRGLPTAGLGYKDSSCLSGVKLHFLHPACRICKRNYAPITAWISSQALRLDTFKGIRYSYFHLLQDPYYIIDSLHNNFSAAFPLLASVLIQNLQWVKNIYAAGKRNSCLHGFQSFITVIIKSRIFDEFTPVISQPISQISNLILSPNIPCTSQTVSSFAAFPTKVGIYFCLRCVLHAPPTWHYRCNHH
jgi:hypothetical protein